MATDYSLNLKATLDTSEVQQKLQQLGQTGTTTTVQMDQAVKNLDKSVKSVAESAKSIADNLIKGASMMRIGQLLQKTGTTAGGVFGEGLAGAGQGAMVGSAAGPYGAAIGAAVGGVISLKNAFESLEDAARSAAAQLWNIATDEKKQFQDWYASTYRSEVTNGTAYFSKDGKLQAAQNELWKRLEEGQADWQTDKEYKAEIEALQERVQRLLAVAKAEDSLIDPNAELKQAILEEEQAKEKLAKEERERAAEYEKRIAEDQHQQDAAAKLVTSIEDQMGSQQFSESLKTMSMADLKSMEESLKSAQASLQASALSKAAQARDIGGIEGANLLAEAQDELARSQEAASRLSQVQSLLGSATNISWLDSMQALGTESQKGYDASGYGNIDQQMLKVEQETKDATKESASTLRSINTKLDEVKNVITSSNNGATWE